MNLMGLGCRAQVGKDTVAGYLEKKFPGRVKRVAFADELKKYAMLIFGLSEEQCFGSKEIKETADPRYGKSPRQILQEFGEKMRDIYEDIWVDKVLYEKIPQLREEGFTHFVISDVRYPNEADKVIFEGGHVVRLHRDAGGTAVGSNHASETSMNDYPHIDFEVENNGTLEELFTSIDRILEDIGWLKDEERPRPQAETSRLRQTT